MRHRGIGLLALGSAVLLAAGLVINLDDTIRGLRSLSTAIATAERRLDPAA